MAEERVRRGRIVAAVLVVLVLTLAATAVLVLRAQPADCTVAAHGRTVDLDRSAAEAVTATRPAGAGARNLGLSDEDARAVAAAVSGTAPAALTCRSGGADDPEPDALDARGLTTRAAVVRDEVRARFGDLPAGGYAPGGVTSGHMPGSAHYDGRAVDVFFRPISPAAKRRGWALAHYLVAHAERLAVDTVIFDGRIWTARRAVEGWRDYRVDTSGRSRTAARILLHRDHVHVDVTD